MSIRINERSTRTREHITCEEFCRAFQTQLTSLYQLALLLTVDHAKAEAVLVAGVDECLDGNFAFKEWAHSWAKGIIIVNAIRLIAPLPYDSSYGDAEDVERAERLQLHGAARAVAGLSPFDRFVFIMSVLERIPDRDCAALMGCGATAIVEARLRALQTIGRTSFSADEIENCSPALAGLEVA